jgi:very-short-patch-repair endonuclease
VAKPLGWRPLTVQEQQDIIRRYSEGELLTALAAEYRRDKKTLKTILQAAGIAVRGVGYPKGREWTPAHREAHRQATSTPEFAQKSREALLERLPRMRGSATNSPIERRMHDALKKAGIGFTTQSALLGLYLVDIEIRQARVIIEADGAHHYLSGQRVKDAERDDALTAAGYRVFRFTGSEINADADECVRRAIAACGLVPDKDPVYEIRTKFAGELHPNWKGGKQEFTCGYCGIVFLAQPSQRRGPKSYCTIQHANAARAGESMSAEQRAKISASLTGKKREPFTAEHRAKLGASVSKALKGKPKTPEHAAKVGAAQRGRPKSDETRAKISASLKQRNANQSD